MGILIRILAKTRLRLIISAIVLLAMTVGLSLFALAYIRNTSQSTVVDFLLITIWLLFCFFSSYIEAILVGDLVFGQRWRERNILSRAFRLPKMDEDDSMFIKEEIKDHTFLFSLFIMSCLFVNIFATNAMSGGFLGYYQDEGYFHTLLRSPRAAHRLRAVVKITELPDERLRKMMRKVLTRVDDRHPEVRRAALWSIGTYADRMVRSLLIHQAKDPTGMRKRWEFDAYREDILKSHLPKVVEVVKRRRGLERRAAIIALGRIRDKKSMLTLFGAELNRSASKIEVDDLQKMIVAIAYARHIEGMELILKFIRYANKDNPTIFYGIWALGELGKLGKPGPDKRPPVQVRQAVMFLNAVYFDFTFDQQCAALDAFKKIRDPLVVKTVIKAFKKAKPRAICPRRILKRRGLAPLLMVSREIYRMKVLGTLMMMVNADVTDFLRSVAISTSYSKPVRERVRLILRRFSR